jgi:hypothetical protein
MQLFELVFIACFFAVVITCLRISWLLLRRRRKAALISLKWLGICVAVYFALLLVLSAFAPQRVYQVGDTKCFDDWCISVEDAKAGNQIGPEVFATNGRLLLVTLRISSRARRVRQSEPHTEVFLLDANGRQYEVAELPQRAFEAIKGPQAPLGTMLDPGGAFTTVRIFDIPKDLTEIGLATRQRGVLNPSLFIIGDEASIGHKRTIFRIQITLD